MCDPRKHRGKIMFRRPAPGRPARQCGHPKSAQCDCLAKRTLCCVLTVSEWDLVEAGQIVRVPMYDSREDLDAAQQSLRQSISLMSDTATNDSFSSVSTPAPQLQQFEPGPDSFLWAGDVTQFSPFQSNFVPQPSLPFHQQNQYQQPLLEQVQAQVLQQQQQQQQQQQLHQQSAPHTPGWLQPRPEYLPFNSPHVPAGPRDLPFESLRFDQMNLTQQIQPYPSPLPIMQESNPALQPPAHLQDVTQSCCSSKRAPPQQMNQFSNFIFPRSAPTQQFPCPRCASTMCTCLECPEVMQGGNMNGAWSNACGRAGHLDANDFPPTPQQQLQLQQQQPQQQSQQQPVIKQETKSCCSGTRQEPVMQQAYPFPQDPMTWSQQNLSFDDGMTVDPSLLYHQDSML